MKIKLQEPIKYGWTPNSELWFFGMYLFELKKKRNKTRHKKITYIKWELIMKKKILYDTKRGLIVNATIFARGVTFRKPFAQALLGGIRTLSSWRCSACYKKLKKRNKIQKISALEVFSQIFNHKSIFFI
ncbi:MAG: hypothetical protein CM15mP87_06370 [Candidatus Neomarinimicrobiota bacterium]|nr:MAG: hypothetical protein CM15mP87_06370 [Candidatus Neomarinimicrobiota bacterium]